MNNYLELNVSAEPESLSTVRLTFGSLAARLDLTVDQSDDLQLAIDELCSTLISQSSLVASRLEIAMRWDDESVEIRASVDTSAQLMTNKPVDGSSPSMELSQRILAAIVDEFGFDSREGRSTAWFRQPRKS